MGTALSPTSVFDTVVVEVDERGASSLCLGGEPVAHVAAAHPGIVMRVLLDYAATVGRDLTVLTRHSDDRRAVHLLHPNGTATPLPPPLASPRPTPLDVGTPRRISIARYGPKVLAATSRVRRVVAAVWAAARTWLVTHGLWLMLCVEILALVASLTFILVALAPYLWAGT